MKLDIFSHCAIDTICINDTNYVVPGGAACYCSLMAKILKFDVTLHTKFGPDFSLADYLSKKKILIKNSLSEKLICLIFNLKLYQYLSLRDFLKYLQIFKIDLSIQYASLNQEN